jgi:hypothetical protein
MINCDFFEKLHIKTERKETPAYIISTLKKYIHVKHDISDKSIVLMWFDANEKSDFSTYQDIGDWVFFSSIYLPQSIKCSKDFYLSIGKSSYYKCYRLLKHQWPLYEEMADNLERLVEETKKQLF